MLTGMVNARTKMLVSLRPTRRWLQVSLRTLFLLTTALGIWLGLQVNRARRQRETTLAIREAGGHVFYDWSRNRSASANRPPDVPTGPVWLRRKIGDEYFQSVEKVHVPRDAETNPDLPELDGLDNLQALSLSGEGVTDEQLQQLRAPTSLEELNLSGTLVTDRGLQQLRQFPKLKKLVLPPRTTDHGLSYLRFCPRLQTLSLYETQISDRGLAYVAALRSLVDLDVRKTGITDAGLARVAGMAQLQKLALFQTRVTYAGMRHLARLINLRELSLPSSITDDGLAHLSGLKRLNVLWLTSTQTTSAGLRHLGGMNQLEKLVLADTLIDDQAIPLLTSLPSLKEMAFVRVMVSQAAINDFIKARPECQVAMGYWFEPIQQCKEQIAEAGGRIEVDRRLPGEPVVALDLSEAVVTEQTIRNLRAFIRLQRLNLSGSGITDDAVSGLQQLSRIQELDISGTGISAEAAIELEHALPACKIIR